MDETYGDCYYNLCWSGEYLCCNNHVFTEEFDCNNICSGLLDVYEATSYYGHDNTPSSIDVTSYIAYFNQGTSSYTPVSKEICWINGNGQSQISYLAEGSTGGLIYVRGFLPCQSGTFIDPTPRRRFKLYENCQYP
jgi:hypothetical protein